MPNDDEVNSRVQMSGCQSDGCQSLLDIGARGCRSAGSCARVSIQLSQ
uniref:Uncharacterized protein n=1 Tax=uncultured marine microorganism HF4000_137B17 TaxID=455523 RepID=B3T264_9ZZZZ|nr:hypothetical protein ALOHA_HF4000137B17ctg1g10 [uncultured marine microorganism HF4000_137B17]